MSIRHFYEIILGLVQDIKFWLRNFSIIVFISIIVLIIVIYRNEINFVYVISQLSYLSQLLY